MRRSVFVAQFFGARFARSALLFLAVGFAPRLAAQDSAKTAADSTKAANKPNLGPMRRIEFDTDEGTWTNVDVSPDGRTILFDMLGDLYTMPIGGGEAKLLLGGRDWDHMPRFSPDGKQIAFISDRDGNMNLWIMNADGTRLKQLSKDSKSPYSSPLWSSDGTVIARKMGRPSTDLWAFHPTGGSGYRLSVSGSVNGPALSPDGRYLYLSGMRRIDRLTGDTLLLGTGERPKISPDGRLLAYARSNDQFTALHLRDLRTGADRRLVASITPIHSGNQDNLPDYAFTPDGKNIVLSIDGKINRVDVATGAKSVIPMKVHVVQEAASPVRVDRKLADGDVHARIIRWPSLSPDGQRAVFSALGKLYVSDVAMPASSNDGQGSASPAPSNARRLTTSDEREYSPAYSPDGKWVAYTTWSDEKLGQVMVIPSSCLGQTAACVPRKATSIAGRYANPAWSRDGRKLAFVRGGGVEQRGGQPEAETYFDVMWVPADGGEPNYVTSTYASRVVGFPMRYYPVISFNPDGTRVFYSQWGRPATPGQPSQATLYSVRLDGTDRRGHLRFTAIDEIIPSPDGRRVAFVRKDQIMVSTLPQFTSQPLDLSFDSPQVPLKRLATSGGKYVSWLDSNTVAWVLTNKLYRASVGDAPEAAARPGQSAAATAPFAEISVVAPRAKPTGKIAFTNARLVTMKSGADSVIQRGTIVVDGSRIVALGPAGSVTIPSDARRIDAAGATITPGFVDVHAHLHYEAFEAFPQQKWEYIANLAYGVTTAWDPSAHNLDVFSQQEMVETGEMIGPRILSTGDVIYGEESVFPEVYENIRNIEDARAIVRRYKAYDPDMLKQYMQPRRDQRQWLAQAAREQGVMITAEGGGDLVLDMTMYLDGYSAVEHALPIAPLYKDVIEFAARAGTHYTPTLIVAYGGPSMEGYFATQTKIHDDVKLRRFTPEDALERWRKGWSYVPYEEQHWLEVSKSAAKITHAGGNVTLGAHGNRQGLGAQWELWGLQMGGLTNMEALREATLTPARKIGMDRDIGSLDVGKFADFLVFTANPLDDIRNTAKLQYTVKNGLVYDAESMTQVWPTRKELGRFFWQTAEEQKRFAAPRAKDPK